MLVLRKVRFSLRKCEKSSHLSSGIITGFLLHSTVSVPHSLVSVTPSLSSRFNIEPPRLTVR